MVNKVHVDFKVADRPANNRPGSSNNQLGSDNNQFANNRLLYSKTQLPS